MLKAGTIVAYPLQMKFNYFMVLDNTWLGYNVIDLQLMKILHHCALKIDLENQRCKILC